MTKSAKLLTLAALPLVSAAAVARGPGAQVQARSGHAESGQAGSGHVHTTFQFTLAAPLQLAAPMFGPNGERCWAGKDWNPEFLYPHPGSDVQGAVFRVQRPTHRSVWVNTVFDLAAGRMQYVAMIPGTVVSIIDVRLTAVNPSTTSVEVTYARTALDPAANEDLEAMGKADRESGPEWQRDIEACLKEQARHTQN